MCQGRSQVERHSFRARTYIYVALHTVWHERLSLGGFQTNTGTTVTAQMDRDMQKSEDALRTLREFP